jgi:hypothetical protein
MTRTGACSVGVASQGALNAPWGVALAPQGFGRASGALLIGNFGDGRSNAYDPASGKFLGALRDEHGDRIAIDGLWALEFGTSSHRSSRPEAERQLAAAVERHREVVASMRELGRPETGQHVAVKAVGRAVHLASSRSGTRPNAVFRSSGSSS